MYEEEFPVYETVLLAYALELEIGLHGVEWYALYVLMHLVTIKACCKQDEVACVIAQHTIAWVYVLYATAVPADEILLELGHAWQCIVAVEGGIEICVGLVHELSCVLCVYLPLGVAEELELCHIQRVDALCV